MNSTVDEFYKNRKSNKDKVLAVRLHEDERLKYDLELISNYIDDEKKILDLGCGTGVIVNEIADNCKEIHAVDKYDFFVKECIESPKVKTYVSDIIDFYVEEKFDIIIIFGVMIYITGDDIATVYRNCMDMLNVNGKLIIRNQFGVLDDVLIDKFSEELNFNYFAEYRTKERETKILKNIGFNDVEVIDIYPKEMNKWDNTHNYALICSK